jgi:Asp-tRNA(Asn)/Glu-tRNA(Gln) amidotransferase A subunit family amidase
MPQGPTRDTLGPITRTVRDNALMLDVLAGYDPHDPVTAASDRRIPKSYTDFLRADGLKGKRIGVLRVSMSRNAKPDAPDFKETHAILDQAVKDMRALGAEVIDPIDVPNVFNLVQESGTPASSYETEVATDAYLAEHPNAPVKTYKEIAESPLLVASRQKAMKADLGKKPDDPVFLKQLQARERLKTALLGVMAAQNLDAFLYLSFDHEPPRLPAAAAGSNRLTAVFAGFPALAIPGGFTTGGLPIGLELMGRPFDEGLLYQLAYGYEQGVNNRRQPATAPPLHP